MKEIGQKEFNKYREKLLEYRTEHYINPVVKIVQGLPKDELTAMAETLISLTSFKRRVSMEEETVGGPIDFGTGLVQELLEGVRRGFPS